MLARLLFCRRFGRQQFPRFSGQRLAHQNTSDKLNGVYWHKQSGKFHARVHYDGVLCHVGLFESSREAAQAYDARLRSLCGLHEGARLKKSLNFPTSQEESFAESAEVKRSRALAVHGQSAGKEDESFSTLVRFFLRSEQASRYEITRLGGSARADALFKAIGSDMGTRLQLKSANPCGGGHVYKFSNTRGYEGMLVVLVALDRNVLWTVPGAMLTQSAISLTLGTARDQAWRASDIGRALELCFEDTVSFPHVSIDQALGDCSPSNKVELQGHLQLARLFACMAIQLRRSPWAASTSVDSLLMGEGFQLRVQEKASTLTQKSYKVSLWKHGGALGRIAYATTDFDLLLVAILSDGRLSGLFAFPVRVLALHELVGAQATSLRLYPPWTLPKRQPTRDKHAWQLEYFVDLRSWTGEPLPHETRSCLEQLLQKVSASCRTKPCHLADTPCHLAENNDMVQSLSRFLCNL